ncbi:putative F-box/LRR-repeat protein 23 [Heracleum sosnowskyi]|uniref:F-box/LRR-repeat protein 23 n=1 Tax=Heracleum sosnowskyi TaxID=360622 RepID=A0AAD8IC37_9APIA|nr:putative F-box/LRR-repeat protein 23 [Heracleum sosnowskyi]
MHQVINKSVDLSCGQLHDLCIEDFGSDNLFKYIYQRSRQLIRLRLENCFVCCYNYKSQDYDQWMITLKGLIQMLRNLPLLEELELPYTRIFGKAIEIVGRCCPHLKSFTLNQRRYYYTRNPTCDKQDLAIAKSMPGLRHLQLFGNRMTFTGLMAILNNCHHLEYLDLRQCYGLCRTLEDGPDLETKLPQQIKHVRFPRDSTEDYEFDDIVYASDGHINRSS